MQYETRLDQLGERHDNTGHEDHQIFSDRHLQFANCHSGPFFLQMIGWDHVFAKFLNRLLGFFLIFRIVSDRKFLANFIPDLKL